MASPGDLSIKLYSIRKPTVVSPIAMNEIDFSNLPEPKQPFQRLPSRPQILTKSFSMATLSNKQHISMPTEYDGMQFTDTLKYLKVEKKQPEQVEVPTLSYSRSLIALNRIGQKC